MNEEPDYLVGLYNGDEGDVVYLARSLSEFEQLVKDMEFDGVRHFEQETGIEANDMLGSWFTLVENRIYDVGINEIENVKILNVEDME